VNTQSGLNVNTFAVSPDSVFTFTGIRTCPKCGSSVKSIACIEDPPVIDRILRHPASKDLSGLWPPTQRTGLPH